MVCSDSLSYVESKLHLPKVRLFQEGLIGLVHDVRR